VKSRSSTPKSQRTKIKGGAVTFSQVHEFASELPGIELSTSYGTAALKVRGRLLARQHQTEDAFVLRVSALDRQILMQSQPQAFYITDHYRDHPWVLVRYAAIDTSELTGLLERAWRIVAPKQLVAQREGGSDAMVLSNYAVERSRER
jgi:hypothetical protein